MRLLTLILCSSLLLPSCFSQTLVDLSRNVYMFSGERTAKPQADLGLLEDSEINAIANACIPGATQSQLERLNLPDLNTRLDRMLHGSLIVKTNELFTLSFSVIQGESRDQLNTVVEEKAIKLTPAVAAMLNQIYAAVPADHDVAFHLLWSRVMDRMWYPAWRTEKRSGNGPPFVTWAIFPESPYTVGTSSYDGVLGGGSNSKTWSHLSICSDFHPGDHQKELLAGAWGNTVDPTSVSDLQRMGLFDHKGRFTGFAYHANDSIDELLTQLTGRYASLVVDAFDYDALSKRWQVSADELWIVLQHETAYAILRNLADDGRLRMPAALRGSGDPRECRNVISLRLVARPSTPSQAR